MKEKIFGDEGGELPIELIKQIYMQILPYDPQRIEAWIKLMVDAKAAKASADEGSEGGEEMAGFESVMPNQKRMLSEKEVRQRIYNMGNTLIQESIDDEIYKYKKKY